MDSGLLTVSGSYVGATSRTREYSSSNLAFPVRRHSSFSGGLPHALTVASNQQQIIPSKSTTLMSRSSTQHRCRRSSMSAGIENLATLEKGAMPQSSSLDTDDDDFFPFPQDFHDQYELLELLGQGSYGNVYKTISKRNGNTFAVKVIPKRRKGCKRSESFEFIMQEIEAWQYCQGSKSVCTMEGIFQDHQSVYLVQELCTGGDLSGALEEGPLSEVEAAAIMQSVLEMLVECHSQHYVFGDVKPANFLLKDKWVRDIKSKDSNAVPSIKVTDFGCAQKIHGDETLERRMGSPVYMAPELWSSRYGLEVDLWASGVLLYRMLSGRYPFWAKPASELDNSNIPAYQVMIGVSSNPILMNGEPWDHISREAQALIRRMLDRSVCTRITAKDALKHPWFQKTLGADTARFQDSDCSQHPESKLSNILKYSQGESRKLDVIVSGKLPTESTTEISRESSYGAHIDSQFFGKSIEISRDVSYDMDHFLSKDRILTPGHGSPVLLHRAYGGDMVYDSVNGSSSHNPSINPSHHLKTSTLPFSEEFIGVG